MATIDERVDGRSLVGIGGVNPTAELKYVIEDADDSAEATQLLDATAPTTLDVFDTGMVLIPRASVDVEEAGGGYWDGVAHYAYSEQTLSGMEYAFETAGGNQHIVHSLATREYAPQGKAAPPSHGLIGGTANGVEGVDIAVPMFQWSETYPVTPDQITLQFKLSAYSLTNRVNKYAFRTFPAGCVQFLGASGVIRGLGATSYLTLRFAAQENLENFVIGDIAVPKKEGWEYLTIRSEQAAEQNAIVQKPQAVYVHQVLGYADLSALGFGS